MRFTKSTDFALRVLVHLAAHNGESCTMPYLSKTLYIPYNNLAKLIQSMSKADIVQTKQGKNGGVSLSKSADEISIKDVVSCIDGPTKLSDCLSAFNSCSLSDACKLQTQFRQLQEGIDELLDSVKVSKLI